MSEYHGRFIGTLASLVRPTIYVELGSYTGETASCVAPHANTVVTVDCANDATYRMTTDEFFSGPADTIGVFDMAFIDADHESGQVMRDFDGCYKRMRIDGFICIHDTLPMNETFHAPGFCADSYKVPDMLREKYAAAIEVLTLPFHPGLTIVRKVA